MSDPLVSFIIPVFNRTDFLVAALESVLSQDYTEKEIIVVDDGSTEGAEKIRAICGEKPVRLVRQKNRGLAAARNFGVTHSRGDLFIFIDDDDLCPPGSVRARVAHWRREPDCHHVIGRLRRFCAQAGGDIEFIETEEEASHYLCMGAALVARRAFGQLGGFDESLRIGEEDVDFWLRSREAAMKLVFAPEISLFYRRHPGNATHNLDKSDRKLLGVLHMAMMRRRQQKAVK